MAHGYQTPSSEYLSSKHLRVCVYAAPCIRLIFMSPLSGSASDLYFLAFAFCLIFCCGFCLVFIFYALVGAL